MSAALTPVGPARVRRGYLSDGERNALAELMEAVASALAHGAELPFPVTNAYARSARALNAPRGESR